MGGDEEWTALIFVFLEKIIVNLKSVFCIVTEFVCLCLIIKQKRNSFELLFCDSEAIRTLDPRLRRALLYPAELRNRPF